MPEYNFIIASKRTIGVTLTHKLSKIQKSILTPQSNDFQPKGKGNWHTKRFASLIYNVNDSQANIHNKTLDIDNLNALGLNFYPSYGGIYSSLTIIANTLQLSKHISKNN